MTGLRFRAVVANRRRGGTWWRVIVFLIFTLIVVPPAIVGGIAISTLRSWSKDLPQIPDLAAWRASAPQTSIVVAADGTHLAEIPFRDGKIVGHRTLVPMEKLPKHLVLAVLAAEDVRFLSHHGVDYPAIARAAWINYRAGRVVEGASTITQQVARNLLPQDIGYSRSMKRKVREALLAREMEKHWTKREILETYLGFVYLGQGAYGVQAAARAYFDRDVSHLDLPESALLAGLVQAPGRLDPFHHPDEAKARRDEVLARMFRAKLIDAATRDAAIAQPLALRRPIKSYGRVVPWYTEQVRQLISAAIPDELGRGGLVVETAALPALGTKLQEDAIAQAEAWAEKDKDGTLLPEVAAMLWDHHTGYVEAMVGGLDWSRDSRLGGSQFDRMRQSCRQPGSAWKPFVYGAGLETGAITPGTPLRDAPIAEYDAATNVHWKPKSGTKFRGVVLVQDAFATSLNAPAIDVFDRTGPDAIVELARKLGISTKIEKLRPMALGASCVKPLELARAYAVIARRGWAIAPRFAVRVSHANDDLFDAAVPEDPWIDPARRFDRFAAVGGRYPDERVSAEGGELLDAETAFQLNDMMSAVTTRGTAAAASGLGRPSAGKTGTTNENTDAWFVGFTARELGAVWIGFDDPLHKLGNEGDGAHAALPLWMRAMRAAEGDRPAKKFAPPPEGMEAHAIDRESGLLASPHAGGAIELWFRPGTAPDEVAGQPGTTSTDFGRSTREF